jgi:ATP-dependent Lon protease
MGKFASYAMARFLPVFPLNLVAFPGETLNLHIFESRYKQLIQDCHQQGLTFGIPAYIDDHLNEYGTEMELVSIEKTYEDGKLDIRTRGVKVFRILEFLRSVPEKEYSAAIIDYRKETMDADKELSSLLFGYVRQFQQLVGIQQPVLSTPSELKSFALGHLVGLSIKEEYQLLLYDRETDRQKYLINHLRQVIPVLAETEKLKTRIRLNGHFREEKPPRF